MGCVFIVLVLIIAPLNTVMMYKTERYIDNVMNVIADNEGSFPEIHRNPERETFFGYGLDEDSFMQFVISDETRYRTRYYSVKLDENGDTIDVNTLHMNNVTDKEAVESAVSAVELGKDKGYKGSYKYLVRDTDYGKIVVFLDCYLEQQMKVNFLIVSFCAAFLCCVAVMVLVRIFSVIAIRPFVENIQYQKRFITDASHELKTPLAIISANTEVLELTQGSNEWTESIKHQTVRMNELIKRLLLLAKFSEQGRNVTLVDFSLSDAAKESVDTFSTLAEAKGKTLNANIADGVTYRGDETGIRQLMSILLDNAVKYADDGGNICFTLTKQGKGAKIEVKNDCKDVDEKSLSHLFERFYRADESRARETGGYGIGLSIAQAIVENHKGKISVKSPDKKSVVFTVNL